MQGYDCVAMDVDLEIGGSDQLFNMMAGRHLKKSLTGKDKLVLSLKLLEDPTGKKMGKTEGNAVNLTDKPQDIFGKIMSWPDTAIGLALELLTYNNIKDTLKNGPMEAKMALAMDVISQIYDKNSATSAQKHFENTFQKKDPGFEKKVANGGTLAKTASAATNISVSQIKRLVAEGGIEVNGKKISDHTMKTATGDKLKIGKKVFVTVV